MQLRLLGEVGASGRCVGLARKLARARRALADQCIRTGNERRSTIAGRAVGIDKGARIAPHPVPPTQGRHRARHITRAHQHHSDTAQVAVLKAEPDQQLNQLLPAGILRNLGTGVGK
jgi:hypothetical protein